MAKTLFLMVALCSFVVFPTQQNNDRHGKEMPQSGPCDAARTQLELNQSFAEEFRKADAHLNNVYANLLNETQGPALQKLKATQSAWIHYRDLHCDAARFEYEGGSMSPMVFAQCMATITEHRIEDIQAAYENRLQQP